MFRKPVELINRRQFILQMGSALAGASSLHLPIYPVEYLSKLRSTQPTVSIGVTLGLAYWSERFRSFLSVLRTQAKTVHAVELNYFWAQAGSFNRFDYLIHTLDDFDPSDLVASTISHDSPVTEQNAKRIWLQRNWGLVREAAQAYESKWNIELLSHLYGTDPRYCSWLHPVGAWEGKNTGHPAFDAFNQDCLRPQGWIASGPVLLESYLSVLRLLPGASSGRQPPLLTIAPWFSSVEVFLSRPIDSRRPALSPEMLHGCVPHLSPDPPFSQVLSELRKIPGFRVDAAPEHSDLFSGFRRNFLENNAMNRPMLKKILQSQLEIMEERIRG